MECFATVNSRGVCTKLNWQLIFPMQTYNEVKINTENRYLPWVSAVVMVTLLRHRDIQRARSAKKA